MSLLIISKNPLFFPRKKTFPKKYAAFQTPNKTLPYTHIHLTSFSLVTPAMSLPVTTIL